MTHWHWVRHGPTHAKTFVGWRDILADLSDTNALKRLENHLPDDALILSSDLTRCVDTAHAITGQRTSLGTFADIREFNFGVWDGMPFDQVAERDPVLSRQYWEQPGDLRAPNGESWNDVAARVNQFVAQMNTQHPNSHIIAVAHMGVIMTQICAATGCTPYQAMGHNIDNLSVTDMMWDGTHWQMGRINHIP